MTSSAYDSRTFYDNEVTGDDHFLHDRDCFLAQLIVVSQSRSMLVTQKCRYLDSTEITDWVSKRISQCVERFQAGQSNNHHITFRLSSSEELILQADCNFDDEHLRITGHAPEFSSIQMAIELGRRLADGRQLDVDIDIQRSHPSRPRF